MKIRWPKGRAGSSPALGTSQFTTVSIFILSVISFDLDDLTDISEGRGIVTA